MQWAAGFRPFGSLTRSAAKNNAAREVLMNRSMLHRAPSAEGSAQDDEMHMAHRPDWICKTKN
jgi:hypothetical protein